jgi:hypothetical protein
MDEVVRTILKNEFLFLSVLGILCTVSALFLYLINKKGMFEIVQDIFIIIFFSALKLRLYLFLAA